jgi:general secretion pathway protein G
MATPEQDAGICGQCGVAVTPDLRYCLNCYSPLGSSASRVHVELARKTATTHRPDPTRVFSPEKHAAILRRARNRKRTVITSTIALLVIVAGLVAWDLVNRNRREAQRLMAREGAARRELNLLADALNRFKADVERYPTNEEGLTCLTRKPAAFFVEGGSSSVWYGPYIENLPEVDPWGNDYVYRTEDGGRTFELFSSGPGGEAGSDSRFRVVSQQPAVDR